MTGLREFFDSYYRLRPVNATFTGVHDYDDRLPDWSPDGLDAALAEMRAVRSALEAGRDDAPLTDVGARDRELAISFLDLQIAETESPRFQRGNPSLAAGEATFGLVSLMTRPFADVESRARSAVARLEAVPRFLAGAMASIAGGVPEEWRTKTSRECEGADILLTKGIDRWIAAERITSSTASSLTAAAAVARSGFSTFRDWLRTIPSAPPSRYAAGSEFFELCLSRGHWCTRDRRELATEAKHALAEALSDLDARSRKHATGGWPAIQHRLAGDHSTVGGYLAAYQDAWDACRRHAVERELVSWPDYPIRYVPIPVHTRDAAPFLYYLFYRSPAPFDRLPVHDYVVTPIEGDMPPDEQDRRLRAANASVITLNHVVHHGAIGHHVQNYQAYHGASEIGRVAAVDCASRIGMFLGGTMAEGWACYATDLMDEHGFLTEDVSLAQQHTRARLLARAVVDVGLHDGSLTFDEAVAVYRDRVGMPNDAARAEVCKNSMFPATAVMYWLGTESIHRIRRNHAGECASLRDFHDRLLAFGSIPVPLIEQVWAERLDS
jgi:Bacterial protein of unknown function (DUF885)